MTLNGFERTRGGWVGVSVALAMAVGCGSASGVPAERAGAALEEAADLNQEANGNPFVFRFDSEPYGISMKEWAYHWLRRMDSIPAATNRFTSTELFFFVGDKSLAAGFDPCVTGSLQPAVADDLFMLFKPLKRGQHVLTTHIENIDGNVFDRTRTITSE